MDAVESAGLPPCRGSELDQPLAPMRNRGSCSILWSSGARASPTTEGVGDNLELSSQPDNPRSD